MYLTALFESNIYDSASEEADISLPKLEKKALYRTFKLTNPVCIFLCFM